MVYISFVGITTYRDILMDPYVVLNMWWFLLRSVKTRNGKDPVIHRDILESLYFIANLERDQRRSFLVELHKHALE